MLRYLSPYAFAMFTLFALLNVASIALGSTQHTNAALAGFAPCANNEWCWFGISPDRTEFAQAEQILFRQGYHLQSVSSHRYLAPPDSNLCDVLIFTRFGEMHLFALVLECRGVSVGDLTTVLGAPTGVALTPLSPVITGFDPPPALVFGEALIGTKPQWLSIYSDIPEIWITRTSSTVMTVHQWNSFNQYSICQLQPLVSGCGQ